MTTKDNITQTLLSLPHVKHVEVDVEARPTFYVTVTIDSEPWDSEGRYEVYELEDQLRARHPEVLFDFRLVNLREQEEDL